MRRLLQSALVLGAVGAMILVSTVGANALTPAEPQIVKHVMPTLEAATGAAAADASSNLVYHGGPIQKAPTVYIVYWGWHLVAPAGALDIDPNHMAPYLEAFFAGVGGSSWAAIHTQYGDATGALVTNPTSILKGVWYDDEPTVPPVPDANIEKEVARAVAHFGYQRNATYFIVSPHNHGDAGFTAKQYCAWHSNALVLGRPVAYTNLPYIPDAGAGCGRNFVNAGAAGALDGVSIVAGHEWTEAATDPQLDAWYDATGWENADKCAWNQGPGADAGNIVLPTGTFAVQSSWSNAANGCAIAYP